jgi:diacylglycerol kinase (ATP)
LPEPKLNPHNERRTGEAPRVETELFYASPFTVRGRLRSFHHAFMGIGFVLRSQHNAWLHAVATVLALALATTFQVTGVRRFTFGEWSALVLSMVMVWMAETFNTGLEILAEAITQERHPILKMAKDVAAAAVLIAALGAVIVGGILFLPPLIDLIRSAV